MRAVTEERPERRAREMHYRATGRLSEQVHVHGATGELRDDESFAAYHIRIAYLELEACVSALGPAIGAQLREAENEVIPREAD